MNVLWQLSGVYGRGDNSQGVLIDNLPRAIDAGCAVVTRDGVTFVIDPDGTREPVLCGDIIGLRDADGFPTTGRCGIPVVADRGACEAHAEERDAYLLSTALLTRSEDPDYIR
jgi:hypothetical protein